ncbi:MAG TPA: hypothetical protein PLJ27_08965 [Polyangiaceae bacterium]|jgi:hypothetical protein|nr:MAG: hypothetical protein BWY17_04771 [Deltaproteobacteria bacterium ADurb.Bin207]HNS99058.1 hypothetical protein [Polyangiaceae bacterium]HNZ25453.1 hypothetical protein [Polyangiaceae bacterium]HOD25238.1 hypothetical protein [Polyangiaceae bacterium]HOE51388.1 hypothetical protein [Polyangiaceae bacterium]
MRRRWYAATIAVALVLLDVAAWAEVVLMLPPSGQGVQESFAGHLRKDSRLAVVELGHQLVAEEQEVAALRTISDGLADDATEFETLAHHTHANWVVSPVVHLTDGGVRLELTAFLASTGRCETVARELDRDSLQPQVREMLAVLLRQEGVGTGALPWEKSPSALRSSPPGEKRIETEQTASSTQEPSRSFMPLLGATFGGSTTLARPEQAVGSSTAWQGGVRAGIRFGEALELALGLRSNIAGPKATGFDLSARYGFRISEGIRVGPELAPGGFVQGGGAQRTSLSLRFSLVGSLDITPHISIEAQAGDITWVATGEESLFLGGATLAAVARL